MLYANNLQDPLINYMHYIFLSSCMSSTYDHRVWKTGLPVRSAVLKPHAGELVVGWVTTSESSLLYVFAFYLFTIGNSSMFILGPVVELHIEYGVQKNILGTKLNET